MKITLTILDILLIFAAMFVLLEWRLSQVKKATLLTIVQGLMMNNEALEKLLDRKDEVLQELLNTLTDKIVDDYEKLSEEVFNKINFLEEKRNSSKDV